MSDDSQLLKRLLWACEAFFLEEYETISAEERL